MTYKIHDNEKNCKNCGKEIKNKRKRKFCSYKCLYEYLYDKKHRRITPQKRIKEKTKAQEEKEKKLEEDMKKFALWRKNLYLKNPEIQMTGSDANCNLKKQVQNGN